MLTYSFKMHQEIFDWIKKKIFFPGTFGCLCYEIAIKGNYRNICYFSVFAGRQESLFIRIKFHYNGMQIEGPFLSCEVETWIIISYGKLKMQKLTLVMSIVLGENSNLWQSPNVLRRKHNYSTMQTCFKIFGINCVSTCAL